MSDLLKTRKPLEGKVASILNERELAINIGSKQGVELGMKFKILAETPTEIIDPDTGKSIGNLDRSKVNVIATVVQDLFTVCKTYKSKSFAQNYFDQILLRNLVGSHDEVETLKAKGSSLPQPLSEEESYVKKGDRVIQITEE